MESRDYLIAVQIVGGFSPCPSGRFPAVAQQQVAAVASGSRAGPVAGPAKLTRLTTCGLAQ